MSLDGRRPRPSFRPLPAPNGDPDRQQLEVLDDSLGALGIRPGARLDLDRAREPADGDVVWVELVRRGSTERLVRRYEKREGVVTLASLVGAEPAIMRQQGELLVLGVVTLPGKADRDG